MARLIGRFFIVAIVILNGTPVQALDFDKEILRQEKMVKVRYHRPPRSLAYFLKTYEACRVQFGRLRTQCNLREAKRRYQQYSLAWQQQQKLKLAKVTPGDMHVELKSKNETLPE